EWLFNASSNIQNYFSFLFYPSHILFKLPSEIFFQQISKIIV
ncbi:hypothetical protein Gotur_034909, partial [Gossypium turneri]